MNDLDTAAARMHAFCQERGWDRGWREGGVYLHLEASEFIEALRGKKGNPVSEAGDVLFVLLSILAAHDLSAEEALQHAINRCNK